MGLSILDRMHSLWAPVQGKCQIWRGYLGRSQLVANLYILQTNLFATFRPAVLWTTEVHWRREEAKMKTVAVRNFPSLICPTKMIPLS